MCIYKLKIVLKLLNVVLKLFSIKNCIVAFDVLHKTQIQFDRNLFCVCILTQRFAILLVIYVFLSFFVSTANLDGLAKVVSVFFPIVALDACDQDWTL